MKRQILLLFSIAACISMSCNAQDKSPINDKSLPEWKKNTFNYTKRIIPKEIEYSGNNFELTPIELKKIHPTRVDRDSVILAICEVKDNDKARSALVYYFINSKTGKSISKLQAVLTVKGCEYNIPAFVIRDIDSDGKDDFIFLESYNDKCSGNYWIKSNYHQIKPKTIRSELDYYLMLRNDMRINKKVEGIDQKALQKQLEDSVEALFKKS